MRGWEPQHPPFWALRPAPWEDFVKLAAPTPPDAGAPPRAPGDFLPDEKVTKESPRGETPLGTPPKGDASLPLRQAATPSMGVLPPTQMDLPL